MKREDRAQATIGGGIGSDIDPAASDRTGGVVATYRRPCPKCGKDCSVAYPAFEDIQGECVWCSYRWISIRGRCVELKQKRERQRG